MPATDRPAFLLPASFEKVLGSAASTSTVTVSLTALGCLLLAGCAQMPSTSSEVAASAAILGSVHGGQQPVSGATISLIEPGTSGYGSTGSVIVSTTTNSSGGFTLPRPYVCPANSGLVYITASGGNAGAGTNTAIGEAAILGPCSSLSASTFVNITEVTTVAAAYALAPFATVTTGSTAIGTSLTNTQGLTNAAGAADNLASTATGLAHVTGDFPGIVLPTAEVNTLADILASCVNQGTATIPTGTCATLFTAATPSNGVAPVDTFQAALNIAKNPGLNTAALYGLVTANPPYQPTQNSAPTDFSLALGFNGGAISLSGGTLSVAIDAGGNAWFSTGASATVHTLTEISPAGVYLSGSTVAATTGFGSSVLNGPVALAIDQTGAVYVDNNGGGNLLKFNPNGMLQSTITATSFVGPNALAIDGAGDAWVGNFSSNAVTEINPLGVEATGSPFAVGGGQDDVAVDPLAIWVSSYSGAHNVTRIDAVTHALLPVSTGASNGGVATDHANNLWVASTGNGSILKISDTGTNLSTPSTGFTGGSVTNPQNVIVDGLGNVFSGSFQYVQAGPTEVFVMGSLLEFSNSGALLSPAAGYSASNVIPVDPQVVGGIAVDGSGNVWIAGTNAPSTLPNYGTEVIGIAAPVTTPKSVAVTGNMVGVRP